MRNKLLVFVTTYKRDPRAIVTHRMLRRNGYTGDIAFVMSTDDPRLDENRRELESQGYEVFVYDRDAVKYDDHAPKRFPSVGHPRAWVLSQREEWTRRGYEFIAMFDDDYVSCYAYESARNGIDLDAVFDAVCDVLRDTGAICVALSQSGDHLGRTRNETHNIDVKRKVMNTFFVELSRADRVVFRGAINEDVNFAIHAALRGELVFTLPQVAITQRQTQQVKGGLTEVYRDKNTYIKSAMSAMLAPRAVEICAMGWVYPRPHHKVDWRKIAPYVISSRYCKE